MSPQDDLYRSARAAAGYAFARPPIHEHIGRRIGAAFQGRTPFARALDVGCGAGRSTAALDPLAEMVVGIDPASTMLAHGLVVAPQARFVVASAEALPFTADAFDLLTAAGVLNYTDLARALAEAARVLAPDGVLVIYDFAAGRRFRDRSGLDEWYVEFKRKYPSQPGYHLEFRDIPYERFGLTLERHDTLEIGVPMTIDAYVAYAMTESGIALALSRGDAEAEIRGWCRRTLEGIFAGESHDVLFDAYVAFVRRLTFAEAPLSPSAAR